MVASLTLTPRIIASETGSAGTQPSSLVFNKEEDVEVSYSPLGDILSEMVRVRIEANNNGSSPNIFSFKDRVESIDASTLTMLYGTPNPKRVEVFGNTTIITWDAIKIDAGSSVEYQYMSETWRNIPIVFNESFYVNGNLTYPKHIGKIYTVGANKSDTLTLKFTIKNVGQQFYTGRKAMTPPFFCTVTASLSNEYFSDLTSSPEANSTSTLTGTSLIAWIFLLNDSVTLSLSAKVKEISTWGEAPVEPLNIQLKPVPETMIAQYKNAIESLADQIQSLKSFIDMFNRMPFLKKGIVEGLQKQLSALKGKQADLEDQLLVIQNQKSPHDVEVPATTYNYKTTLHIEKVAWRAGPEWAIKNIDVTNLGNTSLTINGLALEAKGNQTTLKPKYAFVLVDGDWQMFYGDLAQLGLEYDTRNGTLYLWPRVKVSASESSNVLVDWAGRPIQLVFEYKNEPTISYILDVEECHPNVKAESTKGEISCSIVQPHVFARNTTSTGFNPPPSSQENDWLQVLTEYVWSPAVLISGAAIVLGVLMLQRRRRKTIALNKEAIIKDEAEKSLLHEIDSLKETLEKKKDSG